MAGPQRRRSRGRVEWRRPGSRQTGALPAGPARRSGRVGGRTRPGVIVGVDTGGTFTDVVDEDGAIVKVLSDRNDPAGAVAAGLGDRRPELLCHGTTIATNALLERRGATVALVTNRGFADVVEIARQDRPALYDQWADRPEPLVPRDLRLEVDGRLDAGGDEIEPVGRAPDVPDDAEAVAVCLLHADLDPSHEQAVASELRARGHDVTSSSDVSPEFREYERTVTTVVNAYLRPVCGPYLGRMGGLASDVLVMTSAGGRRGRPRGPPARARPRPPRA